MDELEEEFPLLHPEYSPVLSFLYQNLPFVSILIGTAGNAYAISRLQNSIQLPIRGLAILWCTCNSVSILVVESLFAWDLHAGSWNLGDVTCRLSKSLAMLPVCANPWFLVAAVVSFSRLQPLKGYLKWLLALVLVCPVVYVFYAFGQLETHFDEVTNTTVISCVHVLSRDEFYWTNILSFVFYYNSPVVLAMCFLLFSYQLQQNKTSEWLYCFKELVILFAAQAVCWLPHWVGLFYMIKADDDYSDTVLTFLLVEAMVSLHIGVLVPRGLIHLALNYTHYSVHENPLEPPNVEMQGVNGQPRDSWP